MEPVCRRARTAAGANHSRRAFRALISTRARFLHGAGFFFGSARQPSWKTGAPAGPLQEINMQNDVPAFIGLSAVRLAAQVGKTLARIPVELSLIHI